MFKRSIFASALVLAMFLAFSGNSYSQDDNGAKSTTDITNHNDGIGNADEGGYDINGYNLDGFNREGYNSKGYDVNGYDRYGYNAEGYDVFGYDKNGYDRNGKYGGTTENHNAQKKLENNNTGQYDAGDELVK